MHGSLYTDPAIFAAELEQIWYRTWVYVGHESEVPEPNDYVLKSIGPQPVIMTRDRDGEIHLLLNRCAPPRQPGLRRAAAATRTHVPLPVPRLDVRQHRRAARLPVQQRLRRPRAQGRPRPRPRCRASTSYHGFVFGSLRRRTARSLARAPRRRRRRVRPARRASRPTGEVELTAGWLQHEVRANWKMLLENETDGYHPQFVHASIFGVADSGIGDLYGEKSTAVVARPRQRPHRERPAPGVPPARPAAGLVRHHRPERVPDYVARDARGRTATRAEEILIDGLAARDGLPEPVHRRDPAVRHPAARRRRDRAARHRDPVPGCAGHQPADAAADDRLGRARPGSCSPTTPRCTSATSAACRRCAPEWLVARARPAPRAASTRTGSPIGDATDEVPQRAIWRHYRTLMEARR